MPDLVLPGNTDQNAAVLTFCCPSAFLDTLTDAAAAAGTSRNAWMREAFRAALAAVPPPDELVDASANVRCPADLAASIVAAAKAAGIKKAAWMRNACSAYLAATQASTPAAPPAFPAAPVAVPAADPREPAIVPVVGLPHALDARLRSDALFAAVAYEDHVASVLANALDLHDKIARGEVAAPQPKPDPAELHRSAGRLCDLCRRPQTLRRVCRSGQWYYYCLGCRKSLGVKADHPDGDLEVRARPDRPTPGGRGTGFACPRCGFKG